MKLKKIFVWAICLLSTSLFTACDDFFDLSPKDQLTDNNFWQTESDVTVTAGRIRDEVLPSMSALRAAADEAETLTASDCWPYPTYGDLLFSVR